MVDFKVGQKVKYVGNREQFKGQVAEWQGKNGSLNILKFKDGQTYSCAYDASCQEIKKAGKKVTKKVAPKAKKVVKAVKKVSKKK